LSKRLALRGSRHASCGGGCGQARGRARCRPPPPPRCHPRAPAPGTSHARPARPLLLGCVPLPSAFFCACLCAERGRGRQAPPLGCMEEQAPDTALDDEMPCPSGPGPPAQRQEIWVTLKPSKDALRLPGLALEPHAWRIRGAQREWMGSPSRMVRACAQRLQNFKKGAISGCAQQLFQHIPLRKALRAVNRGQTHGRSRVMCTAEGRAATRLPSHPVET
jgi:hypothetical protein